EKHPDNKAGLVFMTPWLLGFLGITLLPMIASLGLAFTDYSLLAPPEFVGLDNIRELIADTRLNNSLVVTFIYLVLGTPLQQGAPLRLPPAPLAGGHVHLRVPRDTAAADRGAGAGGGAEPGHEGTGLLPLGVLPALAAGRLGGHRHPVAPDVRCQRSGQPAA